jgi:winged helix DNA-binding protein
MAPGARGYSRAVAGPATRTLTQRQLNRALLARQLLLERGRGQLARVVERVGGVQAQYAPSMYIGLWSRTAEFTRDDLTRALERRAVVQGTLMRATIHLTSARDYPLFAAGIRRYRREWWLRVHRQHPAGREMARVAARLRRRLAKGPLRAREIEELLGREHAAGVGLWLDLVRVPPSGTWEHRRADLYAAAEDWVGSAAVSASAGVEHLVRRYLGAFGPATRSDVAGWAGLPAAAIAAALSGLATRSFLSESGEELVDLPRAPLPDPETHAPVRFLPTWDATLLVHARRTGILPERYRAQVFNTKTPHSVPTFLVDGEVAGTWRYDGERVRLQPFQRLDRTSLAALREEAERLTAFHA